MTKVTSLAGLAALIAEPTRAAMLVGLMDGRALTAGELAAAAGVAPATASGHLARMLEAGLLALERQGRHRYYRIANASVADMIERMMSLSGELGAARERLRPVTTGPRDRALRRARLCYDHLAGEVAVAIADGMIARGQLELGPDGGVLTEPGRVALAGLGIDLGTGTGTRARGVAFCRPCLDWSERRPHVAGLVGRAMFEGFGRIGWLRRSESGRAISVTPRGTLELARNFGVDPA